MNTQISRSRRIFLKSDIFVRYRMTLIYRSSVKLESRSRESPRNCCRSSKVIALFKSIHYILQQCVLPRLLVMIATATHRLLGNGPLLLETSASTICSRDGLSFPRSSIQVETRAPFVKELRVGLHSLIPSFHLGAYCASLIDICGDFFLNFNLALGLLL